jgi:coenzyme F420 hydrogenase subunit beta
MRLKIMNVSDVATSHLCCGCGVCAYLAPEQIAMADVLDEGRRPLLQGQSTRGTQLDQALAACPGYSLEHRFDPRNPALIHELTPAWGPVLAMWEGYAADDEIRFAGSSGGAATALALYAIEKAGMHGVLHIAARPDVPYLNHTVMSTQRSQLLENTGSRYAPASPCDGLQMIEDAPAPCVFIGKPCDAAGAHEAALLRPALAEKLGVSIALFCAGTPTTQGTLEMLKSMGVDDPSQVESIRYRGMGWPGKATVRFRTPDGVATRELTYQDSWGAILEKHRPWRCRVCVDHTGEFADVAVGDPWYRPIPDGEPGRSLVLARTERGRKIILQAIEAGYLVLQPAAPSVLRASQTAFPATRGKVWGRIWTSRLLGMPAPRFGNMPMFRFWCSELSIADKIRSIIGTARRIWGRGLRSRSTLQPFEPKMPPTAVGSKK